MALPIDRVLEPIDMMGIDCCPISYLNWRGGLSGFLENLLCHRQIGLSEAQAP